MVTFSSATNFTLRDLQRGGDAITDAIRKAPDTYQKAWQDKQERQLSTARQSSLADLGAGATYGDVSRRLAAAGDLEGARSFATLAMAEDNRAYQRQRDTTEDAWRRDQAARAQANADRSFALQERNSAAKGYDVRAITNPDGTTSMVRIDLSTGAAEPITMPNGTNAAGSPTNPYATGKFNEGQGKAANFADRMAASNAVINQNENINEGWSGWAGGVAASVLPTGVGNQVMSPQRQQMMQAQRDFVNAILRRESGAAISPSEFENAQAQYFPQPGDSPEVIRQKAENRRISIEGLMREAGPSYRPPQGWQRRDPHSTSANANNYVPPAASPGSNKNEDRAQPGVQGAPVRVSSPEEAARLPSGTRFVTPDGRVKVVP